MKCYVGYVLVYITPIEEMARSKLAWYIACNADEWSGNQEIEANEWVFNIGAAIDWLTRHVCACDFVYAFIER